MAAKNLITKLMLLCVVELLLGAFICYAIPAEKDGYIAAIQDKELLLLSSKSPRIIFVGGSNLAFGLDSELVEKEFGLPVINFGLHANLGLETSLNIIQKYAAQGDIIVVVPEYEYFDDALAIYGGNDLLSDFLETDPANIQYIAEAKWIDLPLIALGIPERKINRKIAPLLTDWTRGVYIRSSFNSYGDVIGHIGKPPLDPNGIPADGVLQANRMLSTTSFELLDMFHQEITDKGGIVLFDFPSLRMRNCKNTGSEKFASLLLALKTRTTIPLLSTPYDRCYPDNYFYDTKYHLIDVGREIRTQQVIKSLKPLLKERLLLP